MGSLKNHVKAELAVIPKRKYEFGDEITLKEILEIMEGKNG